MVLTACGGAPPPEPVQRPPVELRPRPVEATDRLFSGNTAEVRQRDTRVIRDQATLAQVWRQVTAGSRNPPPLPDDNTVDFTRDMVAMVALGSCPGGVRVTIDEVSFPVEPVDATGQNETVMFINYTVVQPDIPVRGQSYPVQLVIVERSDLVVRFPSDGCGRLP